MHGCAYKHDKENNRFFKNSLGHWPYTKHAIT